MPLVSVSPGCLYRYRLPLQEADLQNSVSVKKVEKKDCFYTENPPSGELKTQKLNKSHKNTQSA